MKLKRRDSINTAALTGAGLMMTPGFTFAKRRADSKLRPGFIGVGLRGTWHLENSLERDDGELQDFPDFTRAQWIKRQPYNRIKDTW